MSPEYDNDLPIITHPPKPVSEGGEETETAGEEFYYEDEPEDIYDDDKIKNDNDNYVQKLNGWLESAPIGVVIGVIAVAVLILALLLFFFFRRFCGCCLRRRKTKK